MTVIEPSGPSPRKDSCTVSPLFVPAASRSPPISARPRAFAAVAVVAWRSAASATTPVATTARARADPSDETLRTS